MGKNTKIICTVVPNPYKTEKNKAKGRLYFSVFLTPRLPESGFLKDYYEIARWFEFWDIFRKSNDLRVKIRGVSYESKKYTFLDQVASANIIFDDEFLRELKGDNGIKFDDSYTDEGIKIYKKMFKDSTPIQGWLLNEGGAPVEKIIQDVITFDDLKYHYTYVKPKTEIVAIIVEGEEKGLMVAQVLSKIEDYKTEIKNKQINKGKNKDNPLNNDPKKKSIDEVAEEIIEFTSISDIPKKDNYTGTVFEKDTLGHKTSPDEIRLRNKENQEFHKKLSILGSYPHLMRLTGWICDFYIEKNPVFQGKLDNIINSTDSKVKNRALIKLDFSNIITFIKNKQIGSEFDKWSNFQNEIDFKTPWTYFNPSDFSIRYSELFEDKYFNIQKGFINNIEIGEKKTKLLSALQLDMKDYIARKIQFSLSQLSKEEKTDLEKVTTENKNSISSKYSTGVSLYIGAEALKTSTENNPDAINIRFSAQNPNTVALNEVNIDDYILFGHNIDTGYRVDVIKIANKWDLRSLNKRIADYAIDRKEPIDGKPNYDYLLFEHEDEPWLSESAQTGQTGTLYVNEELFRWNNWSLTCPQIGSYTQDEKGTEGKNEFNDIEVIDPCPYKEDGKGDRILPLRFGAKYAFRIRVVDLCGNSPELEDKAPIDLVEGQSITEFLSKNPYFVSMEQPYKRMERIEPVELFFEKPIYNYTYEKKTYREIGEDGSETVYQFYDSKGTLKTTNLGEDLRTFVLRSFVDDSGKITPADRSCTRIISPPRVTPQFAELHGVFDLLPENKVNDLYEFLANEEKEFKSYSKDGVNNPFIKFVTDPIVSDVKFSWITKKESDTLRWPLTDYLKRKFIKLCLSHDQTPDSKMSNDDVLLTLEPGKSVIHSIVPIKFSDKKSWMEVDDPKQGELNLVFIHAVQKPVFINNPKLNKMVLKELSLKPKNRTTTDPINVYLEVNKENGALDLPLATTAELRLKATYKEFIKKKKEELDENNENENGYKLSDEETINVTNYSNISEALEGAEQVKLLNVIVSDEKATTLLKTESFNNLKHSFSDTKYRMVKYDLELVSKFKNFIDNPDEDSNYYSRFFEIGSHKILNSQRPRALQIDKIIPLFDWKEETKSATEKSIVRTNSSFRVYFNDSEWFSTGENEGIAVIYKTDLTTENGVDYKADSIEDSLTGLVTEFGKDPSVKQGKATSGISSGFFKGSVFEETENKTVNASLLGRDVSKFTQGASEQLTSYANLKFDKFPIKYKKGKFYCDIKINEALTKDYYFPFIKFALARYQPNSIYNNTTGDLFDFRFSNIAMTPQVQVLPKREIVSNSNEIRIKLFGNLKTDYAGIKNEFWQISEFDSRGKFAILTNNDPKKKLIKASELSGIDEIVLKKDKLEPNSFTYLEEYEYYEVDGEFRMLKSESDYNPRNDIRKRLVFTYKIN